MASAHGAGLFLGAGGVSTAQPSTVGAPATISAWFRHGGNYQQTAIAAINTEGGSSRNQLIWIQTGAEMRFHASSVNSAGTSAAAESGNYFSRANTWIHVAAVFESATRRVIYVNGSPEATNTTSITASGDAIRVGSRIASGTVGAFLTNAMVADVSVYNRALTASEIVDLSKKASPLTMRPIYYNRLVGGFVTDVVRSGTTASNVFAASSHPSTYN